MTRRPHIPPKDFPRPAAREYAGTRADAARWARDVLRGQILDGVYGGLALTLVITLVVGVVRGWSVKELCLALLGAAIPVARREYLVTPMAQHRTAPGGVPACSRQQRQR